MDIYHHSYLDVLFDHSRGLSILIIDSSDPNNIMATNCAIFKIMDELDKSLMLVKLATGVQKSTYDCMIFSLYFATIAEKYKEDIARIHESNIKGEQVKGRSGRKHDLSSVFCNNTEKLVADILPDEMFLHAHNPEMVKRVGRNRSGFLFVDRLNNNPSSPSLNRRVKTNLSIEQQRITYLQNSMNYLKAKESKEN